MSRVPWWAWAAGAALIVYLFYQHSKANRTAASLNTLQASMGTAPLATGLWSLQDTVSIEQLQRLQSTVYSQENGPQYLNARLNQTELHNDIGDLIDALPQFWPVAVTATAPVTSNANLSPQS